MRRLIAVHAVLFLALFSSCNRNSSEVWDDTKTCGRYFSRGVQSLGGKQGCSRQVQCREEFLWPEDIESTGQDFIPMQDNYQADDSNFPLSRHSPGDPGSQIPGIESFKDPKSMPGLSSTFKNIQFGYNSSLVEGDSNLSTVRSIAAYMRQNPRVFVFVEGHCDERGPEAYNLALGSRRANAVRNALIQEGASPNNLFTISYGKERPLVEGQEDSAWSLNRRAEFKIYTR